ncbi:MAG: MFS transporter [Candidatus Thermoplasmatota archaeon]|nr:MFS transporter [Candidatus Thermoplasmatota archaeon]MCL5790529.1 MFS transporter [Candidatus Thermoplasmatota archaeon]
MEAGMDSSATRKLQLRSIVVSGIGVFSDSYNLYGISLVYYQILGFMGLSEGALSFITGSTYFGAAAGGILFGLIADRIGRKPAYGIDLLLIFIGSLAQFFVTGFIWLLLARLVMGFGIGGDLVMSPVIMAENSGKRNRGKLMATSFSVMYLFGAVLSAFVDQVSSLFLAPDIAWRVVLGFGAVPSLFVIYYRRKIPETYRFSTRVLGKSYKSLNTHLMPEISQGMGRDNVSYSTRLVRSLPVIIAGSSLWILYDAYSSTFTFYGPITIAQNLGLSPVNFTYAAVFLAGLPGTLLAVYLLDRLGRKKMVTYGYIGVSAALLMYSLLLLDPSLLGINGTTGSASNLLGTGAVLGFTFYMFNYFFSAMGPATVIGGTMVVPELIATKVRATAQGMNVFIDRLVYGLAIASFPQLLSAIGLGKVFFLYASIAIVSIVLIQLTISEAKGKSLEDLAREDQDVPAWNAQPK